MAGELTTRQKFELTESTVGGVLLLLAGIRIGDLATIGMALTGAVMLPRGILAAAKNPIVKEKNIKIVGGSVLAMGLALTGAGLYRDSGSPGTKKSTTPSVTNTVGANTVPAGVTEATIGLPPGKCIYGDIAFSITKPADPQKEQEVEHLQTDLNNAGASLKVDGIPGDATRNRVLTELTVAGMPQDQVKAIPKTVVIDNYSCAFLSQKIEALTSLWNPAG